MRSTRSWVRPYFYVQALVRERKEGNMEPVRAEGQVCGWGWHPERFGRKRFGLQEGSSRGGGGGAPSPRYQIVLGKVEKVFPDKFLPIYPFPGLGCDGNSSRFWKCWCMQLFKQQGEGKEQSGEPYFKDEWILIVFPVKFSKCDTWKLHSKFSWPRNSNCVWFKEEIQSLDCEIEEI